MKRIGVIVLVVLLVGAGFVVRTSAPAWAAQDLSSVLPPETVVYARVAGVEALLAELESSTLLHDGKFLRDLYSGLLATAWPELERETKVTAKKWETAIFSIRAAHFALFDAGREESELDALLVLESAKPETIREILDVLFSEKAIFAGEVGGAQVHSVDVSEDFTIFYALKGEMLFVTSRAERISTILDAMVTPPERSLASTPAWQSGSLRVGPSTFFAYGDWPRGFRIIQKFMSRGELREFDEISKVAGLDRIHTTCMASGDGMTLARVTFDEDHPWFAAVRGTPGPGRLSAFVPADAIFFAIDSGSIEKRLSGLEGVLTADSFPEADDVKETLGETKKMLGFSLSDLSKSLGNEWMVCWPLIEDGTRPDDDAIVFALAIGDRQKFDEMMKLFFESALIKQMKEGERAPVTEEHSGATITRMGGDDDEDVPCMAILDDTLLLSGHVGALKACIDARTRGPTLLSAASGTVANLPGASTKLLALNLQFILMEESELGALLDFTVPGSVIAGVAHETPGRIDAVVTQPFVGFLCLMVAGELLRDRYRPEADACLSNLSAIGKAAQAHRQKHGAEPGSMDVLVTAGLIKKEGLRCPLEGDEKVGVSYRAAFAAGDADNDYDIVAWCPHRLHRRLVVYRRGNAWATSETRFLRALRQQGIDPR